MVLVPADDAPDADEPTRKRDFVVEAAADPRLQPSAANPVVDPPRKMSKPTNPATALEMFDAELYRLPVAAPGVFLSAWHALLLFLGALFILILAFTAGLLIGRYVL